MIYFIIGCILFILFLVCLYFIFSGNDKGDTNNGDTNNGDTNNGSVNNINPPTVAQKPPVPKTHDFYGCKMNKIYNNEEGDYIAIEDGVDSEEFIESGYDDPLSTTCYDKTKSFKCNKDSIPACLPVEINNLGRKDIKDNLNFDIQDFPSKGINLIKDDGTEKIFNCVSNFNNIYGYPSCQKQPVDITEYEIDCSLQENLDIFPGACNICNETLAGILSDEQRENCKKIKLKTPTVNCNVTPNHPVCPERCQRSNEFKSQSEKDFCSYFNTLNHYYEPASESGLPPIEEEEEPNVDVYDNCKLNRVNNENITSGEILYETGSKITPPYQSGGRGKIIDNFDNYKTYEGHDTYRPLCVPSEQMFSCPSGSTRTCKPFIANNIKDSELKKTGYNFEDTDVTIDNINNNFFKCQKGFPTCVKSEGGDKIYILPKKEKIQWYECDPDNDTEYHVPTKRCLLGDNVIDLTRSNLNSKTFPFLESNPSNENQFICDVGKKPICEKQPFTVKNCLNEPDYCGYDFLRPENNPSQALIDKFSSWNVTSSNDNWSYYLAKPVN